jgi:hypothetical protein
MALADQSRHSARYDKMSPMIGAMTPKLDMLSPRRFIAGSRSRHRCWSGCSQSSTLAPPGCHHGWPDRCNMLVGLVTIVITVVTASGSRPAPLICSASLERGMTT